MSNVDAPEAQASRCYFSLPHLNSEYTAHQPPWARSRRPENWPPQHGPAPGSM